MFTYNNENGQNIRENSMPTTALGGSDPSNPYLLERNDLKALYASNPKLAALLSNETCIRLQGVAVTSLKADLTTFNL